MFAHYKNVLGQTIYKFYGRYQTDWKNSNRFKQYFYREDKEINLNLIIRNRSTKIETPQLEKRVKNILKFED